MPNEGSNAPQSRVKCKCRENSMQHIMLNQNGRDGAEGMPPRGDSENRVGSPGMREDV